MNNGYSATGRHEYRNESKRTPNINGGVKELNQLSASKPPRDQSWAYSAMI